MKPNHYEFEMTEEDFRNYRKDKIGFCASCATKNHDIEKHDANKECWHCGKKDVFGVFSLLTMNLLEVW